eukprot:TRINITY_DN19260_c0_g1_i1.p1 TRINITY_DN19260_c0_g1~~TRINITY_DN19260_c0_g1_i1.p1  ORF type:complete len:129 (+),score=5.01 TRINITY_DN19260_c0_g1_i1:184-570(+)
MEGDNVQRCVHNNYDNVRICRTTKKMVLRCRDCSFIIRGSSQLLWSEKRCVSFTKDGECADGQRCSMLHIHYKKQKGKGNTSASASNDKDITSSINPYPDLPEDSLLHTYWGIIRTGSCKPRCKGHRS